ncbi:coiled-coil domain-containing protein 175 [Gavia stellata]|uniref:coiled-coil domain-containing protein 175 n=1 Tax=Gavia stellata TaxID=37040 RepID=UPI00289E0E20|nr:coiled-coil domain-containing protein 175 [Gavia stellata]
MLRPGLDTMLGSGPATMLRPGPSITALSSSAVAPAALSRLQSLEKHLKNEDSAFSGEIVRHLEDTIAAIKKLEEIRRHTLECLEEETIKTSNLRFRVQNFPREIIAEMTALVTAARESSAAKINQLQSALKRIADEIELLDEKQTLCERQNAALCEEQEYLRTQYKEKVDLLNERMAMKVNTNVLLIETCDKTRDTEREIVKKREMKKILDTQETKTSKKKHEFENLNIQFLDLQHLISLNSTAIFNEEILIAKLKEEGKQLEKNLELKKTGMLALSEKKIQLDSELLLLQSKIAQEKEAFDKELEKTKEDLHNAKCQNKKLKLENKAVRQKYEQVLEEEQHWAVKRDEMVAKLGKLSVLLDEKLELLANHMMEKKNLEKKIENLEDSLLNIKKSYAEKLASLKHDLKTENKTRLMLQWKLLYLTKQRKLFFSEEENINRKVNERIEAGKKRHAELLLQIEDLEKELFQSDNQVKSLSEEASDRIERMLIGFADDKHDKKDEEVRVKRAIQQSIKTTGKLKEDTAQEQVKKKLVN